jgi:hypothetical protein
MCSAVEATKVWEWPVKSTANERPRSLLCPAAGAVSAEESSPPDNNVHTSATSRRCAVSANSSRTSRTVVGASSVWPGSSGCQYRSSRIPSRLTRTTWPGGTSGSPGNTAFCALALHVSVRRSPSASTTRSASAFTRVALGSEAKSTPCAVVCSTAA